MCGETGRRHQAQAAFDRGDSFFVGVVKWGGCQAGQDHQRQGPSGTATPSRTQTMKRRGRDCGTEAHRVYDNGAKTVFSTSDRGADRREILSIMRGESAADIFEDD